MTLFGTLIAFAIGILLVIVVLVVLWDVME